MVACTAPPWVQHREKGQDRRPDPDPACLSEWGTPPPCTPLSPEPLCTSASASASASVSASASAVQQQLPSVWRPLPLVRLRAVRCAVGCPLAEAHPKLGSQEADTGVEARVGGLALQLPSE